VDRSRRGPPPAVHTRLPERSLLGPLVHRAWSSHAIRRRHGLTADAARVSPSARLAPTSPSRLGFARGSCGGVRGGLWLARARAEASEVALARERLVRRRPRWPLARERLVRTRRGGLWLARGSCGGVRGGLWLARGSCGRARGGLWLARGSCGRARGGLWLARGSCGRAGAPNGPVAPCSASSVGRRLRRVATRDAEHGAACDPQGSRLRAWPTSASWLPPRSGKTPSRSATGGSRGSSCEDDVRRGTKAAMMACRDHLRRVLTRQRRAAGSAQPLQPRDAGLLLWGWPCCPRLPRATCTFAKLLHRPCPLRMTRAIELLLLGDWRASLHMHPLACRC